MANNILIVSKNAEQAEMIDDNLHDTIGDLSTTLRRNEADAMDQLRRRSFDLIVVDSQISKAKNSQDSVDGLEFLEKIFDSGRKIPSILISHFVTNELYEAASKLYECRLVPLGEKFEFGLSKACQALLTCDQVPIGELTKSAVVDIRLEMNKEDCYFEMKGQYEEEEYEAEGILEINKKKLRDLIIESRVINQINPWEEYLQKIGKTLVEEIFQENYVFNKHFQRLFTKIGNPENIKFCFRIKRPLHPLLLEAMFDEYEKEPYWMLKSPICRKLKVLGRYRKMVFNQTHRSEKINCLIIESNVSDDAPVEQLKRSFKKLENIAIESSELYELLDNNRKLFNVDKVEVIDSQDVNKNFADTVRDKLNDGSWQLVHYAGHSYYDSDSQKGYVIFPDKKNPTAKAIQEFGQWLRMAKTQLIFLSSCHSSSEDFVFELANNGLPAIIGFRWDLDDYLAAKYAREFYNHLFVEKKTIEHAFLKTRQKMYKKHKKDRIWASPILVMQC